MTDGFAIQVTRVHTRSMEAVVRGIGQLYGEVSGVSGEELGWNANIARLGPATLVQGHIDNPIRANITLVRHTIVMTRSNTVEARSGAGMVRATLGGSAISLSPERSVEVSFPAGLRTLNLILDPAFLVAQMEALTGESIRGRIAFEGALNLHEGVGAYLFQSCQYIADELERVPEQLPPLLAGSICESLVRALLYSNRHSHAHLLNSPPPPSSRTIVRRAEEYIDAHAGGPIVGSHLAQVTGASVASIEASFQRHRGMSPGSFLRRRRLERAREALLHDPTLSTSRAGQMAGYLGVAAFEAAYFKTFGETPAQTRQRASLGKQSVFHRAHEEPPAHRLALLSPREHEVGNLVARGLLNKQIAGALGISEKMVQKHRGRAMQKLGLASAADLVRLWERIGK